MDLPLACNGPAAHLPAPTALIVDDPDAVVA